LRGWTSREIVGLPKQAPEVNAAKKRKKVPARSLVRGCIRMFSASCASDIRTSMGHAVAAFFRLHARHLAHQKDCTVTDGLAPSTTTWLTVAGALLVRQSRSARGVIFATIERTKQAMPNIIVWGGVLFERQRRKR